MRLHWSCRSARASRASPLNSASGDIISAASGGSAPAATTACLHSPARARRGHSDRASVIAHNPPPINEQMPSRAARDAFCVLAHANFSTTLRSAAVTPVLHSSGCACDMTNFLSAHNHRALTVALAELSNGPSSITTRGDIIRLTHLQEPPKRPCSNDGFLAPTCRKEKY